MGHHRYRRTLTLTRALAAILAVSALGSGSAAAQDCNNNGIPDYLDLLPIFTVSSPELSPIGAGSPQTHIFASFPRARGPVTFSFKTSADLRSASALIDVSFNSIPLGRIEGRATCRNPPGVESFAISADALNTAVSGLAVIRMEPNLFVDPNACNGASFIMVTMEYDTETFSSDCNANGIPDECDISSGAASDVFPPGGDGIPDECQADCMNAGGGTTCGGLGDCNSNGCPDGCDIANGISTDCNSNGIPDECEVAAVVLYGNSEDGSLFTIDTDTGSGTLVGIISSQADLITDIEHDNSTGRSFAQWGGFFESGGQEFDLNTATSLGAPIFNGGNYADLEYVGPTLYGTAFSRLRILDPFAGTSTLIGPTFVGPIAGLAYHQATDTMYGIATDGPDPADLYTIDLETGSATLVGTTSMQAGSLQFGPGGLLYAGGVGSDGGNLFVIDPATAVSTLVGPTGFGPVTGLTLLHIPGSNDCNSNGILDNCESDCNDNGIADECEINVNSPAPGGPFFCTMDCDPDCNTNGIPDGCDILSLTSNDCNSNSIPDECEISSLGTDPDCNSNGILDECEVPPIGVGPDCNANGTPDECDTVPILVYDISLGDLINVPNDCGNGPFNDCASATGFSWLDAGTGPVTAVRIETNIGFNCHAAGTSLDTSLNTLADQPFILSEVGHCNCAPTPGLQVGLNANPTSYNLGAVNTFLITNPTTCLGYTPLAAWGVGVFARVTVQYGRDCNTNSIPDECEPDCNANGIPDDCETCGDLDGDGDVDADDFSIFLGAFGLGVGAVGFDPCADADGDGVITFVDYQEWLQCYRSFIGNPLASPPVPEGVGDMDGNGGVDGNDIQPFVDALLDPAAAGFRGRFMADANGDGTVDSADVGEFVGLLLSQ